MAAGRKTRFGFCLGVSAAIHNVDIHLGRRLTFEAPSATREDSGRSASEVCIILRGDWRFRPRLGEVGNGASLHVREERLLQNGSGATLAERQADGRHQ